MEKESTKPKPDPFKGGFRSEVGGGCYSRAQVRVVENVTKRRQMGGALSKGRRPSCVA